MLLLLLLMANKIGESIFFLHYNRYSLCIKTYNHRAADNLGVTGIALKYIATITNMEFTNNDNWFVEYNISNVKTRFSSVEPSSVDKHSKL